ncbi:MAG TPA: hypothetical protein PKE69_24490 [Pyrinomonadaceae bacterium]|nr:hypothetical protein [Pyrinomonadaceae bacterium]
MRIDTYQKLIEVLTLQVANLPTYQAAIGATNQELQDVTDALDLLIYLRDYADLMDANKQTVFQIKQAVFNGDKEEPIAAFPVFPPAAPPHTPTADLLGDAQARHRRWKSAAGYTEEIGIALGIEENSQPIAPESVKPNIQVSSMQSGYVYTVSVSNRGDARMWDVYEMRKGASVFSKTATCEGKSAEITAIPTDAGNAEQFLVRVQMRKNNQNYGQPSDAVYVTINP